MSDNNMPTEELTYRDGVRKDIQALGDKLELRMNTFEHDMRDSTQRLETGQDAIIKQTTYTNGKLRKVIIAIVLLAGILVGQNFPNWHDIITIFAGSAGL